MKTFKHGDYVECIKDLETDYFNREPKYKAGQVYRVVKTNSYCISPLFNGGFINHEQDSCVVLYEDFANKDSCNWIHHPEVINHFVIWNKKTKSYLPSWL
jgi:hypothetical protein